MAWAILTFLTSFFHSILLLFKLAAISILWMILAEAFGYTTSSQTIKRVARVRRRKITVPLPPICAEKAVTARTTIPVMGSYRQAELLRRMFDGQEHVGIPVAAPISTSASMDSVNVDTALLTLTTQPQPPAVTAPKKSRSSSKEKEEEERRRSRTTSISSGRSSRSSRSSSSGASRASSNRSNSRSKTASMSSTTAHVSARRSSRASNKTEKEKGKRQVKEKSAERIGGWRRERSSSGPSRIGVF